MHIELGYYNGHFYFLIPSEFLPDDKVERTLNKELLVSTEENTQGNQGQNTRKRQEGPVPKDRAAYQ